MVKFLSLLFLPAFIHLSTTGQEYPGKADTIRLPLGSQFVLLEKIRYGDENDIVFVNLHDDERTSVQAAKNVLVKHGGLLLRFINDSLRLLSFRVKNETWCFDPNRIFTKERQHSIDQDCNDGNRHSMLALKHIKAFSASFIKHIPKPTELLIALHNNKPNSKIDILRFRDNNGNPINGARKVNINEEYDKDDFFLTTDAVIYQMLADLDYNILLEDYTRTRDDGSLSIFYGKARKRYVNVEAEHDYPDNENHLDQQTDMIEKLLEEFKR